MFFRLFVAGLVACGLVGCAQPNSNNNNSNSTPAGGARPLVVDAELRRELVSRMHIQILDAGRVDQTLMDATDNPAFYAIDGQLVPRADATARIVGGAAACSIRKRNFPLRNGQVIRPNDIKTGKSTKTLHWSSVSLTSADQSQAFVILCMQYNRSVTLNAMKVALRGMVKVNDHVGGHWAKRR
jgi:hypothetical protein